MKVWSIKFTKKAIKQLKKSKDYCDKINELINIIKYAPYIIPPNLEKLKGFEQVYSRRINIQHRLVYQIFEKEHTIKIISVWGHYDDN